MMEVVVVDVVVGETGNGRQLGVDTQVTALPTSTKPQHRALLRAEGRDTRIRKEKSVTTTTTWHPEDTKHARGGDAAGTQLH